MSVHGAAVNSYMFLAVRFAPVVLSCTIKIPCSPVPISMVPICMVPITMVPAPVFHLHVCSWPIMNASQPVPVRVSCMATVMGVSVSRVYNSNIQGVSTFKFSTRICRVTGLNFFGKRYHLKRIKLLWPALYFPLSTCIPVKHLDMYYFVYREAFFIYFYLLTSY